MLGGIRAYLALDISRGTNEHLNMIDARNMTLTCINVIDAYDVALTSYQPDRCP